METVGPPVDDVELHLLTEWGDPASRGRSGVASVASVLLHIAGVVLIVIGTGERRLKILRRRNL